MGGQKFQYDENGGTFLYFVLSFLALILIPGTYYWWPSTADQKEVKEELQCNCDGCKKKKLILYTNDPWKNTKILIRKLTILGGWLLLFFLAYRVSLMDYEYANFDPYDILGVPLGASEASIKKAYRKQSLILHPDKETGDEKAFMKLTKAYQALTDEESRRNFEKYGNPDGPGAMSFGIALPSYIVEKENSVWVLGLYALVFMVALPTVVGMWWYKSIRYTGDKVLLETINFYYAFFQITPHMALKRVLMILGASLEFDRRFNNEIIERASDEIEVPQLIRQIPNLGEKNRERPLYHKYSIKARALIYAHLSNMQLTSPTLEADRMYIIKKCPYLLQEMVTCISQLILLAYAQRVPRLIHIETLENVMKLCPMIVQGMWDFKNPLLQLPYVTEDHLKHFNCKKRYIKSLQQFAQMKNEERRSVVKFMSDEQYADMLKVLGNMPFVDLHVQPEVIDDEATTEYTAGAIITVTCTLVRKPMSVLFGDDTIKVQYCEPSATKEGEGDEEIDEEKLNGTINPVVIKDKQQTHRPVWMKNKKGGKKKKFTKNKHDKKSSANQKKNINVEGEKQTDLSNAVKKDTHEESKNISSESDEESDQSDVEKEDAIVKKDSKDEDSNNKSEESSDDDDDWEKYQTGLNKRDKALEGRSKQSHSVHCSSFPEVKQEFWWIYISDRKSRTLLTSPYHITELVGQEQVQLKFTAPRWPGVYTFTVCLRCDSYLGFDQMQDIKLDVKEAPEVPTEHPQWEISGEEDEGDEEIGGSDVSEFTTDEDVDYDL